MTRGVPRSRVLVVASTYPIPDFPGVPSFVETLSRALATFADISVVALARGVRKRRERSTEDQVTVIRVGRRGGAVGSGVLSSLRVKSLLPELALIIRWLMAVCLEARKSQPTVVHIHWAFPVPGLVRALRSLRLISPKLQYVVTLHGADVLMLSGRWRKLIQFGLGGAKQITVVSEEKRRTVAEALQDWNGEVTVLPMPVSDEFFGVTRSDEFAPGPFLFVGRLVPKKGLNELVKACERSESLMENGLRVVGTGPLGAMLRQCHSAVHFAGPADAAGVANEMSSARALVCPFLSPEGLPVTVLEAFAAGVPVISPRVSGVQALEEMGFTVWGIDLPVGPESITKAIEHFESDLERRHQHVLEVVEKNRRLAARFAPDRVASEFCELLLRR